MALIEHRPEGYHVVRRVSPQAIVVDEREFSASFALAPDRDVAMLAATSVAQLDDAAVAAILTLDPTLVLLGSGVRQQFPAQALMAAFLRRGIGIEAMDNAAAARTYNLLAEEGRRVVAVFLLASADDSVTPAG
jgi:uncharacterized protein